MRRGWKVLDAGGLERNSGERAKRTVRHASTAHRRRAHHVGSGTSPIGNCVAGRHARQSVMASRWAWLRPAILRLRSPEALRPKQQTVGAPKTTLGANKMLPHALTDDPTPTTRMCKHRGNMQYSPEEELSKLGVNCVRSNILHLAQHGTWSVQRHKAWVRGATAGSGA